MLAPTTRSGLNNIPEGYKNKFYTLPFLRNLSNFVEKVTAKKEMYFLDNRALALLFAAVKSLQTFIARNPTVFDVKNKVFFCFFKGRARARLYKYIY